jgi:hypothetical protein
MDKKIGERTNVKSLAKYGFDNHINIKMIPSMRPHSNGDIFLILSIIM